MLQMNVNLCVLKQMDKNMIAQLSHVFQYAHKIKYLIKLINLVKLDALLINFTISLVKDVKKDALLALIIIVQLIIAQLFVLKDLDSTVPQIDAS